MTANGVILEVQNVSQEYGYGERRFTAIQDVSLTIREGEYVTLLGPSGCGKSTLLRIITGLNRPTEGKVLYRGQLLQGVNPHATIVFQTFALFPWLTVQQNVEMALEARGVLPSARTVRALKLIDLVGLDGFETAYPRELSGGMRQKVGFARALAVEPELLCLDEPFSALDVLSAESLRGELLELWTSNSMPTRAILMVTHNIEEAVFMSGRIVIMEKGPGRVVADLTVDLPHPRQRKSHAFLSLVDRVYAILAGQTQPEKIELGSVPGQPGQPRPRALPAIFIGELAGLMEHLDEAPDNWADIYRLRELLHVDSDHLLALTDAAEMLGFATIQAGDITLTPLGETFAEASILARKEIFAARLRRLPMFKWLLDMLRAAEGNRLKWNVVHTALQMSFPPDEAEKQLNTVVSWGRYAELLGYDDDDEVIYAETEPVVHQATASG
ncbi:MAG: AAA-associated domain-containing protein [Anaerolineae bacterium]|nr:AAA-associated domain-containing protein [Anaerolineae bacterium]